MKGGCFDAIYFI